MNEKVDIEIQRRRLTVEMEGLTPIEVTALAQRVDQKMGEVAQESQIADTAKLAILTALSLAADLARLEEERETAERVLESKIEELSFILRKSLGEGGLPLAADPSP